MPVCLTPGCPNLVPRGRCATCAPHRAKPATDSRYGSQRWRDYTRNRLAQFPFCHWCGKLARVTDHIEPVAVAPHRFWDESNHVSACWSCNRARAMPTMLPGGQIR
jgi:5-methylcytosine-specific restriction endonuclease McrA